MRRFHRRCGRIVAAALGVAVAAVMQPGAAYGGTVTWVGPGSGTWSDAVNWSSNPALPGAGDDVVIGAGTVTVDSGTQAAWSLTAGGGLTVTTGGTLTLSADSTIAGPLTIMRVASWADGGVLTSAGHLTLGGGGAWTSGSITGPGTTTVAAGTTLAITPQTDLKLHDGHTLENAGRITFDSSANSIGLWHSTITNLAGATMDVYGSPTYAVMGGIDGTAAFSTFNNAGTFNKSGTGGWFDYVGFNNSGVINVSSGSILLYGDGSESGTINVSPGATFAFRGGTHDIAPGAVFNGPVTLGGEWVNNPVLRFTGDNVLSEGFTLLDGTLAGAGKTIVPVGTTLSITPTPNGNAMIDHRDLQNAGTINIGTNGGLNLMQATFTNLPGATINASGAYNFSNGGGIGGSGGSLNNAGTINKSDTGGWSIKMAFNNSGTVNVLGGKLMLSGGGTQTGTINVAPGTSLQFSGGVHNIDPSARFSGAVVLSGGTLNFMGGDNTVLDGFSWVYGTLTGAGKTVVPADRTLTINPTADNASVKSRTLENAGTLEVTANSYGIALWSATLRNLPGATINFHSNGQPGAYWYVGGSGDTDLFDNAGTVNVDGTNRGIGVPFSNTGTVNVLAGGLGFTYAPAQFSGGALTGGTWNVSDNAILGMPYWVYIDTIGPGASVTLDGRYASFSGLQSLAKVQGSFTLSGGQSFSVGHLLTNTGVLTVGTGSTLSVYNDFVSSGTLTNDGTIDLMENRMVLDYVAGSPVDWLRGQLLSGRNGGAWDGGAGVVSSVAAEDSMGRMGIGYAEASTLGVGLWGNTGVDGTAVVAGLTYYGDANLDGVVGADDFVLLDRGLARGVADAHWTDGDFNYDGVVDQNDYLLADRVFVEQGGAMSPDFLARREAQFGPAYVAALVTSVPEPSVSVAGLILVGAAVQRRRRREA